MQKSPQVTATGNLTFDRLRYLGFFHYEALIYHNDAIKVNFVTSRRTYFSLKYVKLLKSPVLNCSYIRQ